MWAILKAFIEFITVLLLFNVFFSSCHKACGVLAPRPGNEPAPPALGKQSLNHWTAREVPTVLHDFKHV